MNATSHLIAAALSRIGIPFDITGIVRETAPDIVNAEGAVLFADVPPRTIVTFTLRPEADSAIRVEVWLPDADTWNGRFLGRGSGGMAGMMMGPDWYVWSLKEGYVVAYTDLGTTVSGVNNPGVWKDFGHRATHLMTKAGKAITENFYARSIATAYFFGTSTGGQQAFSLAQRHPEDYDGILAGVPAHDRLAVHAFFVWNEQIVTRCPFTEGQQSAIVAAGLDYMTQRERGGGVPASATLPWYFQNPVVSATDIEAVIALACAKDPTLTPEHRTALRLLFEGPRRADTGEPIHGGLPIGAAFRSWKHFYPFHWVFGDDWDYMAFRFADDYDAYRAALSHDLDANDPDLSRFHAHGGKFLAYSGALDPAVPFHPTLAYARKVCEHAGGSDKAAQFFRYYIIPGLGHGHSPFFSRVHPDPLALLRDWRENNVTPATLRLVTPDNANLEVPPI